MKLDRPTKDSPALQTTDRVITTGTGLGRVLPPWLATRQDDPDAFAAELVDSLGAEFGLRLALALVGAVGPTVDPTAADDIVDAIESKVRANRRRRYAVRYRRADWEAETVRFYESWPPAERFATRLVRPPHRPELAPVVECRIEAADRGPWVLVEEVLG